MAKATLTPAPVVVQPPPTVTLELTYQEAVALRILTGNLNGHGQLREVIDEIWDTLCRNVRCPGYDRLSADAILGDAATNPNVVIPDRP